MVLTVGAGSESSEEAAPIYAIAVKSPPAIIDTIAGGGTVGDGGPALSARISLPGGITEAPNGDLILVDFGNHRVRRIAHDTGMIETIAGTGEAGYNGDEIPASRAQLSRPEFAVFGPDGDLFIADSYNNRVRRINHRTNMISTVAGTGERGFSGDGGAATAAELHFPEGIAVDIQGNLFISDTVNRRIRRVDARTGMIATYAGTGEVGTNEEGTPALQAKFLRLARIAVDRNDNLYVADSPSHRILVIDPKTRLLRTFAGTGTSGFSGDGGLATEANISFPEGITIAANGDLYFADVGNHRVRKVNAKTGFIGTVAGTGEKGFQGDGGPALNARLWSPGRVWVDHNGNVLIADILSARIRRVDAKSGVITTVVGTGDWGDGGPARNAILAVPGDVVYADGKVYVADYGTRRVRRIDLSTGKITTVAGGGTHNEEGIPATQVDFLLPEGIAIDPHRKVLYVSDSLANKVWKVDLSTGIIHTFAGGGKGGSSDEDGTAASVDLSLPSAIAVSPDGQVYIGDFGHRRVVVVDAGTNKVQTLNRADGSGVMDFAITSMDATPQGIFLLRHGSSEVEFFDPSQHLLAVLPRIDNVPAPPSGDSQIIDVAARGNQVYLADATAQRILRLDVRARTISVVAGSGIQGFSGDGGPADRASLFQPGGIAVSDDGRELFIADTKNHRIRRVRLLENGGGN